MLGKISEQQTIVDSAKADQEAKAIALSGVCAELTAIKARLASAGQLSELAPED